MDAVSKGGLAAAGETVVSAGIPVRLERTGRPEVRNALLQWRQFDKLNSDIELRGDDAARCVDAGASAANSRAEQISQNKCSSPTPSLP